MDVPANIREVLRKIKPIWGFITDELPEEYLIDIGRSLPWQHNLDYKFKLIRYTEDAGEKYDAKFVLYIFNDKVVYESDIEILFGNMIVVKDLLYYKDKRPDVPPNMGRMYKCH